MAPRIDDPEQGTGHTDVCQVMACSQLQGCRDVVLLYPHHGDLPPGPVRTRFAIAREGGEVTLHVAALS